MDWQRFVDRNKNGIYAGIMVAAAIAMLATAHGNGARDASGMNTIPVAKGYYPNCDAARTAGAAPIMRDEPGYRPELDRDNDGIACEPWRYSDNAH